MTLAWRSAATASSAACAASAGKAQARLRNRFALRRGGVGFADETARGDAVEHAVARRARRCRRTIGPARFRRLRQRDQKRRLGEGEPQRLLAEIGERGRPHALEIAAERREHEIAVERPLPSDLALDLERARDLAQFGGDRALGPGLDQPRDLHRQGRAPGDHMAAHQPLRAGANEGAKVDPVVLVEAPVLVGDKHRKVARIDVMRGRRQAPAPVRQGERPEQPAVAIDDDRRAFARGGEIERAEARRVALPCDGRAEARRRDERERGGEDEGEEARRDASRRALIGWLRPTTFSRRRRDSPSPSGRGAGGEGEGLAPHFALTVSSPKAVRP